MNTSNPDTTARHLVYATAHDYLAAHEPDEVGTFDAVFDVLYNSLDSAPVVDVQALDSTSGRPFDLHVDQLTLTAAVTFISHFLVQSILASRRGTDIDRLIQEVIRRFDESPELLEIVRKLVEQLDRSRRELETLHEQLTRDSSYHGLELLAARGHGASTADFTFTLFVPSGDASNDNAPEIFGPWSLRDDPVVVFSALRDSIDRLRDECATSAEAAAELADLGAEHFDRLLPSELRERLAELANDASPRTLWIQSDEPNLPWELLRLPRTPHRKARFLCEAFDLCRWRRGPAPPHRLPCRRLALVALKANRGGAAEFESLRSRGWPHIEPTGPSVEIIESNTMSLRHALRSGQHDLWHFAGHSRLVPGEGPQLSLESGPAWRPHNLSGDVKGLGGSSPFVFLNTCRSDHSKWALSGVAGWAAAFLDAGAAAFLGTHWAVDDAHAARFARVFYDALFAGRPLLRAVAEARRAIRAPHEPTWLAYTLYAHPLATRDIASE